MEQQGQGPTDASVSDSNKVGVQAKNEILKDKIMKSFPGKGEIFKKNIRMTLLSVVVVLFGVFSGWYLSNGKRKAGTVDTSKMQTEEITKSETEAGIADESSFSDSVEGLLVEGGISGEGTHHLERVGGPSQYVYLTSTVIDLQSFVGKNVKVWGETLSAVNAGWLMDVGKVKVVN